MGLGIPALSACVVVAFSFLGLGASPACAMGDPQFAGVEQQSNPQPPSTTPATTQPPASQTQPPGYTSTGHSTAGYSSKAHQSF